MTMKYYIKKAGLILQIFLLFLITGCKFGDDKKAAVKIIFDTDISGDWSDVGAVAVLHSLANSGEAEILAMGVSITGDVAKWGASCLGVFNTYYRRPDIPIGISAEGNKYDYIPYSRKLTEEFSNENDTIWDATELYRKILSEQPDSSVVFVTVGLMTNIAKLLQSKPDEYSKLNGIELVRKKAIRWVCMAGRFPEGGYEYNVSTDVPSAKYAFDNWPCPILFSGYKIGARINTGTRLPYLSETNPVRRVFEIASCPGCANNSFDQTAVLAAVRDPNLYWGIVPAGYSSMSSNPEVGIQWDISQNRNHAYLVEKIPARFMEDTIEDLMMDLSHSKKQAFFTIPLDNTIRCVKGENFGFRLPYYNYTKGEITMKFENLPDWMSFSNDSIFGLTPEIAEDYNNIQAVLYNNNKASDTVLFSISILENQTLITDIYAASGCSNSFKIKKMEIGDKIYVDRPFKLNSIEDTYLDYTWIVNPTNDGHRYDLGDQFISFTASSNVNVLVGYHKKFLGVKPDWLNDWSDTNNEITDDAGDVFRLYKKTFPKGEIVLGNNATDFDTLRLMYLILVQETEQLSMLNNVDNKNKQD